LIWDVAAGWLIVCEAGGVMTALDGTRFRLDRPQFIAAASEALHREIRSIVN
jgi:myo-inositol-1(or 4)-monophosphatase